MPRATPTVPHPKLLLLFFFEKLKNLLQQFFISEHLQEFAKIYLANPVFCQLLKSYAK
jgi:hypothetical protein